VAILELAGENCQSCQAYLLIFQHQFGCGPFLSLAAYQQVFVLLLKIAFSFDFFLPKCMPKRGGGGKNEVQVPCKQEKKGSKNKELRKHFSSCGTFESCNLSVVAYISFFFFGGTKVS